MVIFLNLWEKFKGSTVASCRNLFLLLTLSSLLATTALTSPAVQAQAADLFGATEEDYILGDVNGDGMINVVDVNLIMQHSLGIIALTETQQRAANVSGKGRIDVIDVMLVIQYSLALIDEFPKSDPGPDPDPDANAELSDLTVDPGSLTPSFAANITDYTVEVDHDTDSIDITATLVDADASLMINGQATGSGVARSVGLNAAGQSTAIEVVVTAADETTKMTYTVTVNRAGDSDPDPDFTMVQVGSPGVTYTIPTETDDSGTAQVAGGYKIATTPVTYELWYTVREWAEANGYHFQNQGMEGSVTGGGDWPDYYNIGNLPTTASLEPVTMVSWRDCVVWLNALSEKEGLSPVYRTAGGNVIRDSRDDNAAVVDEAEQTDNNGYRLLTSMEWEMAARWKNDTASTDGSIERGGRWWTPGNYASGATANVNNAAATGAVAWYGGDYDYDTGQGDKTHPVGLKNANHLGLYDMSGNVNEWCFDWRPALFGGSHRVLRGGSCYVVADRLRVGDVFISRSPWSLDLSDGFRFSRTP